MMDIPKLRLLNQQLANPLFHSPKELVSWMGAVQAQDYAMAKWAVGMRLATHAVIGVDLDYETVGGSGSMLMVTASGTAVFLE